MKPLRHIVIVACVVASFIACADEPARAKDKTSASQPTAAEVQPLQGTWEGVLKGDESQRITIRISGNSLHFHRDTNFWFETTFTLPAGADPKQLHATIKGCPPSQADSVGKVVGAIYAIEDGTLSLVSYDLSEEPPKTVAGATSRYVLKKVAPPKKNAEAAKAK